MTRYVLVGTYLSAIVAANLLLSWQGAWIAAYNAFFFIGLDLVCRDRLHELWRGHLVRNLSLLIVSGSALSYVLSRILPTDLPPEMVAQVAFASAFAFGAASVADSLMYHLLRHKPWYERVNGSNVVGAGVDSLVFVALWPFGFQFTYAFTLWAAKVAGGVAWAMVLKRNEWAGHDRELRST